MLKITSSKQISITCIHSPGETGVKNNWILLNFRMSAKFGDAGTSEIQSATGRSVEQMT
jgi:hypothetical protein